MAVLASVTDFFFRFGHKLIVILLSCVPVIESRYAIVICRPWFTEIPLWELVVLTQVGAFLTALILLLALKPVFAWMKSTRLFRRLVEKLEAHGRKKGAKLQNKMNDSKSQAAKVMAMVLGVYLFVAVPLPGTGVWTGCLVATLLNIRFKYAFPAIALGSVTATAIMLVFSRVFFAGISL